MLWEGEAARDVAQLFAAASALLTVVFYAAAWRVWGAPARAAGAPPPPRYDQKYPVWSFEASFWLYVVMYIPLVPVLLYSSFAADPAAGVDVLRAGLDELHAGGAGLAPWLDTVALSAAFASMAKDGLLFPSWPPRDWLLALHHLGVMTLSPCFLLFPGVRAVRCAVFSVPAAELGTALYCAFLCWRGRWTVPYAVGMTASNAACLAASAAWLAENLRAGELSPLFPWAVCGVCWLILVIRQVVMVSEVRGELAWRRAQARKAPRREAGGAAAAAPGGAAARPRSLRQKPQREYQNQLQPSASPRG